MQSHPKVAQNARLPTAWAVPMGVMMAGANVSLWGIFCENFWGGNLARGIWDVGRSKREPEGARKLGKPENLTEIREPQARTEIK